MITGNILFGDRTVQLQATEATEQPMTLLKTETAGPSFPDFCSFCGSITYLYFQLWKDDQPEGPRYKRCWGHFPSELVHLV